MLTCPDTFSLYGLGCLGYVTVSCVVRTPVESKAHRYIAAGPTGLSAGHLAFKSRSDYQLNLSQIIPGLAP